MAFFLETVTPEFDTIMCLSTTKVTIDTHMLLPCACKLNENFKFQWIHLNFGDEGLKRVFRRIYAQLRPGHSHFQNKLSCNFLGGVWISCLSGGTFILESQAFCTYRKKKKLTEKIFHNFKVISFDVTNIIDGTSFFRTSSWNQKISPISWFMR